MNGTAPATVFEAATATPDDLALADPKVELTWREAATRIARTANALATIDTGETRPIAVLGDNSADTMIFYAAAVAAGIGTILVNHHLSSSEVCYLLEDSDAGAIWTTGAYLPVAREAAERAQVAVLDEMPNSHWRRAVDLADSVAPSLDRPTAPYFLYTSGTTGLPKGVTVPRELPATIYDRLTQMAAHHFAALGPHLVAGPLYHAGPHGAVGLLLTGTTVVVPGRFDAEVFLDTVQRYSIATSGMVPTHFVRLLKLPAERRERADLSSLRLVTHTGSPCPTAVKRAMIDWFGPILRENYGGSESGIISLISSPEWLTKPGSVGRVQAPFEALVIGDDGEPCATGQDGQLYFRDATGRGIRYYNAPEKTAAAHRAPGVFTLGDVGHVDEDGYLFVTGRSTDMIISGGVNIYPAECEWLLRQHAGVRDVALFGVPDEEMGERLIGIVTVADPGLDAAHLIQHCRERIAHYKVPKMLQVVDEVPRNTMGKVNKRELARVYAASNL